MVAPLGRRAVPGRARGARAISLLLLVAVVAVWFAYYERQVTGWIVMTDELLYAKLGVSVGSSLSPLPRIHGEPFGAFSQLYPILTAPFHALLDFPTAFEAIHLFNGLLMASTAVPSYLLARELVVERWAALLAAALSVCVPWASMGLMMLTESAAYPAFAWALLAMQRAIAAPRPVRDLVALVALVVAFLARTQFIVLAIALPLVIVLHEFGFALAGAPRPRREALRHAAGRVVRGHLVLVAVYGLAALALLPLGLSGAGARLLGNYAGTVQGGLVPPGLWPSVAAHIGYIIVGLGILPFVAAAGWAAIVLLRPRRREDHAFAVLLAIVVVALVLQVASFSLRFAQGFQDRYLFYVVPLIVVGFVACLLDRRRVRLELLAAGVFTAWLLGHAGYLATPGPYFGSPATAFHQVLDGRSESVGRLLGLADLQPRTVVMFVAVAGAVAMVAGLQWLRPRVTAALLGSALLVFGVAQTHYVFQRMLFDNQRVATGGDTEGRDWIDRVVDGADVALLPAGVVPTLPDPYLVQQLWWDTEFWNDQVIDAYSYAGAPTFTPFPSRALTLDFATGRLAGGAAADYLVMPANDLRLRPRSTSAVASPDGHLELLRSPAPLRAEWATQGITESGWTVQPRSIIRLFGPATGAPASRRVELTLAAPVERGERRRYRLSAGSARRTGSVTAAAPERQALAVCVPPAGHVDVALRSDETTTLPDGTEAGLQVSAIRTLAAPSRRC